MNKIILGYDIMTYNGPIPNCLDPKFLNTIHKASDFKYEQSGEFFSKKWNMNWSVYNSNFYISMTDKISITQIRDDKEHKGLNYEWFYIVEPFADLNNFFGNYEGHHDFALESMSKVAIDEIKNGNGKLFFNYIIDGGVGVNQKNFEKILKFTIENEIPNEKVYFVFSDFKLKQNFEKLGWGFKIHDYNLNMVAKSQEFANSIKNPNFSYWGDNSHEPQVGRIISPQSSVATSDEFLESIGKDKKDFLLLNRHWKIHRLLLLSHLHKLGLDNNLVSWDRRFYAEDKVEKLKQIDNNEEFIELIKNESKLLDIQDLTRIAGFGFENKEIYLDTYISIVTESIFFQEDENFPTGYISEKLWKPIGHCQPFILAGPAKSLKYIKDRFGYKTFHPYIDESYDLETDDMKRLEMIKIEMSKFSNKTKEEKDEFLNNVKDICLYNQKLFLEYGEDSWKPIELNKETRMILEFLSDGRLEFVKTKKYPYL